MNLSDSCVQIVLGLSSATKLDVLRHCAAVILLHETPQLAVNLWSQTFLKNLPMDEFASGKDLYMQVGRRWLKCWAMVVCSFGWSRIGPNYSDPNFHAELKQI